MNWIRIAVGIMRDPSILRVAEALGVSVPATTGHVVGVLTALPEGSATGDLSEVSDRTLEHWAMWTGKRGKFAEAFRAHLCDPQGVVRAWDKHNGASIRRAQEAATRAKQWREERKTNAQRTHTQCVANTPRESLRNETRRNETNNNNKPLRAVRTRTTPPAKFPRFGKALCDLGYTTWLEKLGAVDYAQFRKAFGPVFEIPEAERPAAMPRDDEFPAIIRLYAVAIRGTRAAQFVKPSACANVATHLAAAAREPDAERRLLLARHAMGTAEEARRMERVA